MSSTDAEEIPIWKRQVSQLPRWVKVGLAVLLLVAAGGYGYAVKQSFEPNRPPGFDLSSAIVPTEHFHGSRFVRDRIPALTDPEFTAMGEADFPADDEVLVFTRNGETHVYPYRVMIWHEVVNDTVGGQDIVATYCPLCGTGMVFDRQVDGEQLTFGNSSMTYKDDLVLYDHQTDSLWSQLMAQAITGPMAGKKLELLPSEQMTFGAAREHYPEARVLSRDTGYSRPYNAERYLFHSRPTTVMAEAVAAGEDLPGRATVLGVIIDGEAKAYLAGALPGPEEAPLRDTVSGVPLELSFDPGEKRGAVHHAETGEPVPAVSAIWAAWQRFYPDTAFYTGTEDNAG